MPDPIHAESPPRRLLGLPSGWRWEHLAALTTVLLLGLLAGLRPGALAEVGRAATVAALTQEALTHEASGIEGARHAAEAWRRAGRYRPADPRYQEALAERLFRLYQASGQAERAKALLRELNRRGVGRRGEPRLALLRGALHMQLNEPRPAAEVLAAGLRRGAELDTTQLQIRSLLASAYDALGRHDEAEQLMLGLYEAHPQQPSALNGLAYHYAVSGRNLVVAERLAREALARHRRAGLLRWWRAAERRLDRAAYLDTLGWIHYKQGKMNDAESVLREAVRLSQDQPSGEILYHLAQVYYDRGNDLQADQVLREALRLQPTLEPALRLRQAIEGGPRLPGEIG